MAYTISNAGQGRSTGVRAHIFIFPLSSCNTTTPIQDYLYGQIWCKSKKSGATVGLLGVGVLWHALTPQLLLTPGLIPPVRSLHAQKCFLPTSLSPFHHHLPPPVLLCWHKPTCASRFRIGIWLGRTQPKNALALISNWHKCATRHVHDSQS